MKPSKKHWNVLLDSGSDDDITVVDEKYCTTQLLSLHMM